LTLCRDQRLYCSIASPPISHYSNKNSLILCVVFRLVLLCRLCFRCSSSARNKTMSDIHRRVVRRALLQTGYLGVDPEKARRGLLSFRSRRKRGNTKAASGGEEEEDLPGPSAAPSSKRKRTSDLGAEETINDSSRSPVKRSSVPSKLPPKFAVLKAFYEGLEAAVSLLAIRCQRCTFESVCSTVEATTQRYVPDS
jgi:hypothetical protein